MGEVRDATGQPVADAIVTFTPLRPVRAPTKPAEVKIDQMHREFLPHVSVIPSGASVSFPNSDHIHHHVYSVSPAKRFEIKLYKGTPAEPIHFEQPGLVVLGCNIHDWMVAYVLVTDTPYFARSDVQGAWSTDLAPGEYRLGIWHPDLQTVVEAPPERLTVSNAPVDLKHTVALGASRHTGKPPPTRQQEAYRDEP